MGMCGGIATGFACATDQARFRSVLIFNFGRLISYSLLGLVAGFLIGQISPQLSLIQTSLRLLAGALMVAMGLHLSGRWNGLLQLEKLGMPIWMRIQPLLKSIRAKDIPAQSLWIGLLWGLLPCGLIYSTLIWAAASTSGAPLQTATIMFAMGLGTLPSMLSVSFVGLQIMRSAAFRQFSAVLLIGFGLWTALTPLAHQMGLLQGQHHSVIHSQMNH